MNALLALLLCASASAEPAGLPPFLDAGLERVRAQAAPRSVAGRAAAARETPEERARHAASLTWPGGPRSTYRAVVDPAHRRAPDPARDIIADHWPGSAPGLLAGLWYSDGAREIQPFLIEGNVAGPWRESSAVIARLTGKPRAIVSPEYIAFRSGAVTLIAPAVYGFYGAMPPFQSGYDAAHPWLNLVQFPADSRGDDCVSLNLVGGAVSGCGDVWQDGIDPANELACYEGKTYLRCHLWCAQQTLGRAFSYANGPCP